MRFCLHHRRPSARPGPAGALILLAAIVASGSTPVIGQIFLNPPGGLSSLDDNANYGVYLPTERTLVRGMAQAERRIAAGEYTAAIAFLNDVLARDEDSFVPLTDDSTRHLGLKAAARRLIADLPDDGAKAYRLQQAARAEKRLAQALAAGDYDAVSDVVRQYFHTPAGYEAALVMAQRELDRGHPWSAARIYQQLLDAPRARAEFGQQLSLLAAASYAAAGEHERAADILDDARGDRSTGEFVVAGRSQRLVGGTWEYLAALDPALPSQRPHVGQTEVDWIVHRGDPARNASYPGGPPHMRPRWRARVANHPRLESYLENRQRSLTRAGLPLIPVGSPLAVGDVVVYKTPRTVVAVNWQSGMRVWETRAHSDPDLDRLVSDLDQGEVEADMAALGHPLDERIWDDRLASALSSDGKRIFTIRGLELGDRNQRLRSGFQGFAQQYSPIGTMTNRLAAYDLATEGKLVWEIDGRRARNQLSGAFFLGAPLAVDETLYVLAEIRSAVYLVVLDAETGACRWRQSLVNLERGVHLNAERARAAPEPSFAEGILVCPTSTGAVVAVDLLTRSLAWAHLYPPDEEGLRNQSRMFHPRGQPAPPPVGGHWSDGPAIIADGRVIVTPRDGSDLLCLDLTTGELLWQRPRRNALFVGCVEKGVVMVVEPTEAVALRLSDGKPSWDSVPDSITASRPGKFADDAVPSGHGMLSEGQYYLPMSNGAVAAIELATGEVRWATEQAEDRMLGNLICHRGAIISQSALSVDKFDQRLLLLERTNAALAKNARDPAALRDRGEIALAGGEHLVAAEYLKRAHDIDPDDLLTRELLAETLLNLLRADYAAHQQDVPLLDSLIADPGQRFELMRLQTDGLTGLDQRLAALEVLLELADGPAPLTELVEVSPGRRVRGDRWLQERLSRLWSEASPDERKVIEEQLAARRAELDTSSFLLLGRYLARFDGLPGADALRVEMAHQLLARQDHRDAELAVLRLERAADPATRLAGAVLALELMREPFVTGDWDHYARLVSESPLRGDVRVHGHTAAARLEELNEARSAANPLPSGGWSERQVVVEQTRAGGSRFSGRGRRSSRQVPAEQRLRIEQEPYPHLGLAQFSLANNLAELSAYDPWGGEAEEIQVDVDQVNVPRRRNAREAAFATRLGHLLLLSLGGEIVAVDTRSTETAGSAGVLWRCDTLSGPNGARRAQRLNPGLGPYDHSTERKRLVDRDGNVYGSIGPVTARGVVFHDGEALRCVDPATGDVLWSRSDVPAGGELFGDEQYVFVKPPRAEKLEVYELISGRAVGQRDPPAGDWLLTTGRHVATIDRARREKPKVTVTNLWSGDTLFERDYSGDARLRVGEPDSIAVVEPSGRFQLIDVAAGRLQIDQPIKPAPRLKDFQLVRDRSRLFLLTNESTPRRPVKTYVSVGEPNYPLVTGKVYAFELASGQPVWSEPAEVEGQGIALHQPPECPLLVFTSRVMGRSARGKESQLCVLCLDKETGLPVYRTENIDDGPGGRYHVVIGRDERPSLVVQTPVVDVELTLSDEPRVTTLVAGDEQDANIAENSADEENGLWKLGGQIGKGVLDALGEALPGKRTRGKPPLDDD